MELATTSTPIKFTAQLKIFAIALTSDDPRMLKRDEIVKNPMSHDDFSMSSFLIIKIFT